MSQRTLSSSPSTLPWALDPSLYDRFPELREPERAELSRLFSSGKVPIGKSSKHILQRLLQPIQEVLAHLQAPMVTCGAMGRILCLEMHRRGIPFWAWSVEEWRESLGPNNAAFGNRYGWQAHTSQSIRARSYLPGLVYILLPELNMQSLLNVIEIAPLAQKLFGKELILQTVRRITTVLESWGYQPEADVQHFTACICYLLLVNRSPRLEDLSSELLEAAGQRCTLSSVKRHIGKVSRALFALGITTRPLSEFRQVERMEASETDEHISEEWQSWCQRWQKHSTHQHTYSTYYPLLEVGRWLFVHHPEITSPEQWTYELAAEFVAAVNTMKVGEWSTPDCSLSKYKKRFGQPLRPSSKARILGAMRIFLRDCQEWHWIPVRVNPSRAFRTPPSIQNQLGPNPRVIDRDQWAKLLWAAMNLQLEDLPLKTGDTLPYPIEMVRAIAVVWCFAALRVDEIQRLRMGCIRWQWEDVTIPETGEILPKDAVCFLDIPVNKTLSAYTKPVHPLVGQRINEWEQVRPKEQPCQVDGKTSELVQFLFSYRGKPVSKMYINTSLIPLLCRKAGIPQHDSRGNITSHRARASIASQLYNAKEPLTLFELKEYLGHKNLASTQYYARVDPTKLASRVAKAGYLEQNMATIEVLLDQDAVRSGAAAQGEVWKYYDLGHGYCTNDFWAQCKHRMACARCPFYRPKTGTLEQLVEGKANLVRMLEFVKLTENEKLLVTEGIDLHQTLIEQLADVPTPAGPTPRELEASRQAETKVVPLETVKRSTKKKRSEQE